ncbi:ATP-dependent DNA ligase [Agromyces sp. Marseille-Q5079]|uniref:DUF7882 family protein n=1 Tax=Agromyces sp. Marseille-Q5079 TaxID=3439059 RepID=UPI003D9CB8B6
MTLRIDDRVLAHLQVVVIDKLRRLESFTFTWDDGANESVCWIGPSIPLEFVFSGNRRPVLNREWLELMAMSANSNSGLIVMPEPAPVTRIDAPGRTQDAPELPRPARPGRTRPPREPVSA